MLHLPDARGSRERRPAFLVLHGFGSSKDSGGSVASAKLFAELGYAALRFGALEVLMPGERGSRALATRTRDGIPLPRAIVEELRGVAARFGVAMFPSAL